MADFSLELQLFGPFAAFVRGEPLPRLRSRKGHYALALLALRQGREVSREWLAGTLWPESVPEQAYYNLRQCLTDLRRALGVADCLQSPTPKTLLLNRNLVYADVTAFDAVIAKGTPDALETAIALYRGPLLEGCAEEWIFPERALREQNYLAALETIAERAAARGDSAAAIGALRQLLAADPLRESASAALMRALTDCGDFAAVTSVYRELRLLLRRELNAEPSLKTQELYRRLQSDAEKPARIFLSSDENRPPRRLPAPLTRLIGREAEIAEITGALAAGRLVTLTGSGGVGKTRLSIAVGEALGTTFPDGIYFIELASLTSAESAPQIIARTLGILTQAQKPLPETLIEALTDRSLLLILDNCEHLSDGMATLTDALLSAAPTLRVLATSRQPLGLTGEYLYRVPSLTLPPTGEIADEDAASLLNYSSVRLFAERAQQSQATFRLTRQNVPAIRQICRQLEGIPLALELAAARLRSLSAEEIAARLQDRFTLLTGGSRAALPRQQTLRALIDWSYDLLTAEEKIFLRRLSVFAGGWTLEAAEAVDASLPTADLLASLADRSLIFADTQEGAMRYRMLETVRQYTVERLWESGEREEIRRRHGVFYLALAEEERASRHSALQADWLKRVEVEYDNLRLALTWSQEAGDGGESEFRLTTSLYSFWYLRGYLREGRVYLERAAARAERMQATKWQAFLLLRAGGLASLQGDVEAAENSLRQAQARAAEGSYVQAAALLLLGTVALDKRDYAAATPLLEQARSKAARYGFRGLEIESLVWPGSAARWRGDYAAANDFYHQAEALTTADDWYRANIQGVKADLALAQGNVAEAYSLACQSLRGYERCGDRTFALRLLLLFAEIALMQGKNEKAGRLLAFVAAHAQLRQTPLPPQEQEHGDRLTAQVRAALSAERFTQTQREGRRMEWEQALAAEGVG